jgi:hypothetical protein
LRLLAQEFAAAFDRLLTPLLGAHALAARGRHHAPRTPLAETGAAGIFADLHPRMRSIGRSGGLET